MKHISFDVFDPGVTTDCYLSNTEETRILGKYGRVLLTHGLWRGPTSEWPSVLAGYRLGCPVLDLGKLLETRQVGCHSATLPGTTLLAPRMGSFPGPRRIVSVTACWASLLHCHGEATWPGTKLVAPPNFPKFITFAIMIVNVIIITINVMHV